MIYESRIELLREAADSLELQEDAGIEPMCKVNGMLVRFIDCSFHDGTFYDFPVAVLDKERVFIGSKLWDIKRGEWHTVNSISCIYPSGYSWQPPASAQKTVPVVGDGEPGSRWEIIEVSEQPFVLLLKKLEN